MPASSSASSENESDADGDGDVDTSEVDTDELSSDDGDNDAARNGFHAIYYLTFDFKWRIECRVMFVLNIIMNF